MASGLEEEALRLARSAIPNLSSESQKGRNARIGVMGGFLEYSSSLYFASISSLTMGADLVFVFCPRAVASTIKSYSSELIVVPVLDEPEVKFTLVEYFKGIHALVIGPGLSKNERIKSTIFFAIEKMKGHNKLILIDGDALHFIAQDISIIKNYPKAILTPNSIEFSRFYKAVLSKDITIREMFAPKDRLADLCRFLGPVTISVKGPNDHISDGKHLLVCSEQVSAKRCGGQGDFLVGSMANFVTWCLTAHETHETEMSKSELSPFIVAAFAACVLARRCHRQAADRFGRSTTTADIIREIPEVLTSLMSSDATG